MAKRTARILPVDPPKEPSVSEGSVLADGKRELRFGCECHPETKVCPTSCNRA